MRQFLFVGLAGFAAMTSMRICDALLPSLADSFGVSAGAAATVISGFAIAYGVLQLVFGPLGDRYGKERVIGLAVLASMLLNLAIVFAPTLGALIALRVVAGAAAGGVIPLSMAHIGDSVPYAQRQSVLARFIAVVILGMISGQWLGGVFADLAQWRAAFVLMTILFAIPGAVFLAELRRNPGKHATPTGPQPPPLRQMGEVLRTPWARVILAAALVEGAFVFSSLTFIPTYLHWVYAVPLTVGGGVVASFGVGGLLYAYAAPRLLRRIGETGLPWAGGALLALGFAMLVFSGHWGWALPACFVMGLGFYMLHNTLQANATQMAPQARGTGVALFACSLFLGQSLGVGSVSVVVDTFGIASVFIASMIVLPLLAAWFAYQLPRRHANARQAPM